MKGNREPITFIWRITATHTIAYFIAGIIAFSFMNYDELFGVGSLSFMRPTDSPWVAAGSGLQVIRRAFLGIFLMPFKSIFLETKKGWIKFWTLSFGLSYFLTFAAAIGSFEGVLYTRIPLKYHLMGIPEMVIYLTLFTLAMRSWYKQDKKAYNIISISFVSLIILMSFMGVMDSLGKLATG